MWPIIKELLIKFKGSVFIVVEMKEAHYFAKEATEVINFIVIKMEARSAKPVWI